MHASCHACVCARARTRAAGGLDESEAAETIFGYDAYGGGLGNSNNSKGAEADEGGIIKRTNRSDPCLCAAWRLDVMSFAGCARHDVGSCPEDRALRASLLCALDCGSSDKLVLPCA